MLHRKLLLLLLSLTALLLALALAALLSLQGVFARLDHISTHAGGLVGQLQQVSTTMSRIQMELHELESGRTRHLDTLIEQVHLMRRQSARIGEQELVRAAPASEAYASLWSRLDEFEKSVGVLATAQDPLLAGVHNLEAMNAAARLGADVLTLSRLAQQHLQQAQSELTSRFRWLVIGIALGFLLVLNTSVLLMLRAAGMVLRPVDRLVAASRELAREKFDHRVEVDQRDEFDELARAFNRLAQQLQENERKRIVTLQQVALTLNHELNNAIAIIELQLSLLRRQGAGRDESFSSCLEQIHRSLSRMADVVESLKHVRRIVLTDYVAGVKMLDLERSVRDEPAPQSPAGADEDTLQVR